MSEYRFTPEKDWFSRKRPKFKRGLSPYRDAPSKFLEVGSLEGRSATWLLDNILTHPESHLTCVDPCYEACEANLRFNLSTHIEVGKCRLVESHSQDGLPELIHEGASGTYDFAYIDGCHHSEYVLRDAVMAFLLIKPGGMIAFDDYGRGRKGKQSLQNPRPAINRFLYVHQDSLEVIEKGYQVWARKTRDFPS